MFVFIFSLWFLVPQGHSWQTSLDSSLLLRSISNKCFFKDFKVEPQSILWYRTVIMVFGCSTLASSDSGIQKHSQARVEMSSSHLVFGLPEVSPLGKLSTKVIGCHPWNDETKMSIRLLSLWDNYVGKLAWYYSIKKKKKLSSVWENRCRFRFTSEYLSLLCVRSVFFPPKQCADFSFILDSIYHPFSVSYFLYTFGV